jgi:hypothetical protein
MYLGPSEFVGVPTIDFLSVRSSSTSSIPSSSDYSSELSCMTANFDIIVFGLGFTCHNLVKEEAI